MKATAETTNVLLTPIGEHWGDWGFVVLRMYNTTMNLNNIVISQQRYGGYWDQSILGSDVFELTNCEHVKVYASLNGHSNNVSVGGDPTNHKRFNPLLEF